MGNKDGLQITQLIQHGGFITEINHGRKKGCFARHLLVLKGQFRSL